MNARLIAVFVCAVLVSAPIAVFADSLLLRDGNEVSGATVVYANNQFSLDGAGVSGDSVRAVYFTDPAEDRQPEHSGDAQTIDRYWQAVRRLLARFPDAAGIVLSDYQETEFFSDGKVTRRYHFAGHVTTPAVRDWGQIRAYFDKGRERVRLLLARTILPDGTITELAADAFQEIKQANADVFFDQDMSKAASLPSVTAGVIVEYIIETELFYPENPELFQTWFWFGDENPVALSQLDVIMPVGRQLHYRGWRLPVDTDQPEIEDLEGRTRYRWKLEDLPPLITEPNMPSVLDFLPLVRVAVQPDMNYIYDWLGGLQRQRLEATPEITAEVERLIAGAASPDEQIARIYHWVQQNVRYISIKGSLSSGQSGHPAYYTYRNRYGDCTDKAILFGAMLGVIGIRCDPIILMTNDSYSIDRSFPGFGGNHCISLVHHPDGRKIVLDATSTVNPYPSFSWMDAGVEYMNALDRSVGTVPLPKPEEMRERYELRLTIAADGTARGRLRLVTTGDIEAGWRGFLLSVDPNELLTILSGYFGRMMPPGTRFLEITTSDAQDLNEPLRVEMICTVPQLFTQAGELLFLLVPGSSYDVSPVSLETRRFPLRTQVSSKETVVILELPPRVSATSLPPDDAQSGANWSYASSFRVSDNTIIYEDIFQETGRLILPEDYPAYRAGLLRAAENVRRRIVLTREEQP